VPPCTGEKCEFKSCGDQIRLKTDLAPPEKAANYRKTSRIRLEDSAQNHQLELSAVLA